MPSSNQYSSSHRPPTSAPPAPEWRVPAAPPRPPRGHSPGGLASPPPPPPPPPLYNPSTGSYEPSYGPSGHPGTSASPIAGFAGVNTATWGVNYNRQNHLQTPPPPPLPPRPSSASGQQTSAQSPAVSSADPYKPAPVVPSYGGQDYYQQWASDPHYASQQPAASVPSPPPPPPPPPPVDATSYNAPAQPQPTWNQPPPPTYPNHYYPPSTGSTQRPPPTHTDVPHSQYYPPVTSPSQSGPPPAQPTTAYYQNFNTQPSSYLPERPSSQSPAPGTLPATGPPLPPKASPLVIPTGASALGFGGPSDWEHLSPVPGNVDDVDAFKPRRDPPVSYMPEQPLSHEAGTAGVLPNSHSSNPSLSNPSLSNPDFSRPAASVEPSQYHTQSPISIDSRQDSHPPPPARMDTTGSDYTTTSLLASSENIDGVIEAWNKPLSTDDRSSSVQYSPKVEPQPVSPHMTPSPAEATSKQSILAASGIATTTDEAGAVKAVANEPAKKTESPRPPSRQVDRYEDLDSWSQSSLERYVAMLRTEAVADSDEERFKIFTTFVAKETKLREILYSIEHEAKTVVETPKQPAIVESPVKEPEETRPKPTPDESGLIPVETEEDYFKPANKADDMAEVEDGAYSPGGRPILPKLHTPAPPTLHRSVSNPDGHKYSASSAVAAHALRPSTVPPQIDDGKTMYSPLTTNPPQRIYTPFRYTEGPQRGSEKLEINRPAYQAYSALRQAQAESGRVMADSLTPAPAEGNRSRSDSSTSIKQEHDETFVGLIREKSVNYRKSPLPTSTVPPLPPSLRQGKPPGPLEQLREVTFSPVNKHSESLLHSTVRKDLERFPNDFSFVRETFKSWEAATKSRRDNLDHERMKRQEESESHIDALFNEKEIGYADINILEEEFRQSEARTQLEEERYELEDFIANVYQPVDKRLEDEISTLQVHYDSALNQLDRENGSKDEGADKHSISHTMKIVNDIHNRLEIRHHKRLEIALDRERRRKKAERRPLVFMGDSAALKKLDNDFDQMEKRNILEAAQARDDRANKLMDLFDDAIMLGLGENQSLLDDISAKVNKVDEAAIRTSGLPDAEIEQTLKSVHSLVEYARKDSESILHSFGVADSALNNADYSVSVAEARYANAEPDVFRQLEAEKKKEDAKIQDSIRDKLQSVRMGPAKITSSINDALRTLGKTPFPDIPVSKDIIPVSQLYDVSLPNPVRPASTIGVAARKLDGDPEHRERLRKALEDAKKRNAARQPATVPEE